MNSRKSFHREVKMMIAGGFTCQRYGFNVGADKFSLLTIENGKNKHYAPIGMDIDFPKPKISLRQAARDNYWSRWTWIIFSEFCNQFSGV